MTMRFAALASIVLFSTMTWAGEWRPLVSVGGLVEQPTLFDDALSARAWHPVLYSPGVRADIGLQGERYEWYAGFYISHSATTSQHQNSSFLIWDGNELHHSDVGVTQQTTWHNWRVFAGFRRYITPSKEQWSALLGGGVNLGIFKLSEEQFWWIDEFNYPGPNAGSDQSRRSDTKTSDAVPGLTAEFGVKFQPQPSFAALLLTSVNGYLHRTEYQLRGASNEDLGTESRTYLVVNPALTLQLRYIL